MHDDVRLPTFISSHFKPKQPSQNNVRKIRDFLARLEACSKIWIIIIFAKAEIKPDLADNLKGKTMDDFGKIKTTMSLQVPVAYRKRLDEEHFKTGMPRGHIMSMALRDWFASRDGTIPLHSNQLPKIVPGDVSKPVHVIVVPRDQYAAMGAQAAAPAAPGNGQ